jgi:hypothetical protein
MENRIYIIDDAKRHQALLDYVESDLIDQVHEANCPTRIEALKKIKAVQLHPELETAIDEAWEERMKEISDLNYFDKLGGVLLGLFFIFTISLFI